ncbi:MAG: hypothetical protein HGA40_04210, partial [Methanoregulaceae archaeon]|nr:hypothetical protein [Methanoregulaceae archaeon]
MRVNAESITLALIVSLLFLCSACGAVQVASTAIPVCFMQNNGQTDEQVLYFADAAGYTVYLTKNGGVISTANPLSAVQITYQGSDPQASPKGEDILPGKANFLIGNDESMWIRGVPLFASVRYKGLYPGTDLVYHGGPNSLKSEYVLEPGADPSVVRMQYAGQEELSLDASGNLLVTTSAGTFSESAPYAYQVVDGQQVPVACRFSLAKNDLVTFSVGDYDTSLPLIIDPEYNFSTYLGGTQNDMGAGIGLDDFGNVYVVGSTQSTQFPLANSPPYQQKLNGSWDIFAVKFSPDGSQLLYSTYIGGNNTDMAGGMAVRNSTGEVFITGSTDSLNYPSLPPVTVYPKDGLTDAFVTSV